MKSVHRLSDRVANQIAAGEVIERPAAVVKELMENSIDAGATRVEVEFSHGGRALMRIEDNGHGMLRDDAVLSIERHATSKITEADDLNSLGSFGFRGEALPSIASVSKFTLQTRPAGSDSGTEILINGGKLIHVRDCGRAVGTRIEVAQLFNSVPARRKFLKTDATESAHIISCVRLYALAFPSVSFTLIEDGRVIFRSPECPGLVDRVAEIFGSQLASTLVPINAHEDGLELRGLIARPGPGRATRHEMISFVNQRPVDNRTLNYALIESYHDMMPKGRYPAAFLFLDIDPTQVDVNVHPAKREVRFRSEAKVRGFVIRSVLQTLRELGTPPGISTAPPPPDTSSPVQPRAHVTPAISSGHQSAGTNIPHSGSSPKPADASTPSTRPGKPANHIAPVPTIRPAPLPSTSAPPLPPPPPPQPHHGSPAATAWRYIGLVHGVNALFETPSGLVLLDRRAAQERILFERIEQQFASQSIATQRLLLPIPLELDPVASALLTDRLKFLAAHGFEVAEFGRHFFRIEGIPDWMDPASAAPFLRDLLGAIRDGQLPERDLAAARQFLTRLSATRAVRLQAAPSAAEMQTLVTQLFACSAPHTSPSGRATHIELTHGELDRRFQR